MWWSSRLLKTQSKRVALPHFPACSHEPLQMFPHVLWTAYQITTSKQKGHGIQWYNQSEAQVRSLDLVLVSETTYGAESLFDLKNLLYLQVDGVTTEQGQVVWSCCTWCLLKCMCPHPSVVTGGLSAVWASRQKQCLFLYYWPLLNAI